MLVSLAGELEQGFGFQLQQTGSSCSIVQLILTTTTKSVLLMLVYFSFGDFLMFYFAFKKPVRAL